MYNKKEVHKYNRNEKNETKKLDEAIKALS